MNRRARGFTLLETVVALTLLAAMLAMLFAGLRTGARAWDAGSARGDRADQVLLTASFLRKEITAAFPWRFKDPMTVRFAFRGSRSSVQLVSTRPAEVGGGGLSFVSFALDRAPGETGGRLVMRRTLALADATDFSVLDTAEPFVLLDGVTDLRFSYFGAENDLTAAEWRDTWEFSQRLPTHVRLEAVLGGTRLPDIVVALKVGEEAGCNETLFQRNCMPRR